MFARIAVLFVVFVGRTLAGAAHAQCVNTEVERWSLAAPNVSDQYGTNVALDGDWAVVGCAGTNESADANAGAAYVYFRDESGWHLQQKLRGSETEAGDDFGISVAIDGDVLVVGARAARVTGPEQGEAYVFVHDGSSWSEKAILRASDASSSTRPFFGESVAISGDVVVVGAYMVDHTCSPGSECGQAYVFVAPSGGWVQASGARTESRKLAPLDLANNAQFGTRVDVEGDVVAIGAIFDDSRASPTSGVVYVFSKPTEGWPSNDPTPLRETCRLEPLFAQPNDWFAFVAVGTHVIAVGANYAEACGRTARSNTGAVYVFDEPLGGWTGTIRACPVLVPDSLSSLDGFGHDVDLDGDRLIVGARLHGFPGAAQAGQAYAYEFDGMSWNETHHLRASDLAAGDTLGFSVALDGDTALVGAIVDDVLGVVDAGSAYVFDVSKCSSLAYCFGDGSLAPCPCDNESAPGSAAGCRHSGGSGVKLELASTVASIPVVLACSGLPANALALLFRTASAAPAPFTSGDGLGCLAQAVHVWTVQTTVASSGLATIAIRPAAVGQTRHFQIAYRDPAAAFCTPSPWNSSNGLALEW